FTAGPTVIMSNSWIRARLSRPTTWLGICALLLAGAAALAVSGLLASCALMLIATIGAGLLWARRHVDHQKSVDAHFKALIDQSTDGIVIADPRTQALLYANPAFSAALGYTEAEVRALTLGDLFVDGDSSPETVLARLCDAGSQRVTTLQQR